VLFQKVCRKRRVFHSLKGKNISVRIGCHGGVYCQIMSRKKGSIGKGGGKEVSIEE